MYNPVSAKDSERFFKLCARLKAEKCNLSVLIDSGGYFNRLENGKKIIIEDIDEIEDFARDAEIVIAVSQTGMKGILDISEEDMLAVTEGGVGVSDFLKEIRGKGLFFPLGTPLYDNITMAQLVDEGFVSDLDSGYGNLREYILSLEIVTPAGEVISSGSRSVKDVAGYNITGFVYGAMGRCGLITKVVSKLLPAYKSTELIYWRAEATVLEMLSSKIIFEVGSLCQTIYHAGSLRFIEGGKNRPGGSEFPEGQPAGESMFSDDAVLGVRLESESADALQCAQDAIEKIIISNSLKVEKFCPEGSFSGRDIIEGLFNAGEEYAAVIHISFTPRADIDIPAESIAWENLYPRRIHYLIPCNGGTRISDLRGTPVVRSLSEEGVPGLRAECIVPKGDSLEKLPIGDWRLAGHIFNSEDGGDVKIVEVIRDVPYYFHSGIGIEREGFTEKNAYLPSGGSKAGREDLLELNQSLLRLFDPVRMITAK